MLAALAVRSLPLAEVFVGEGRVVLEVADASYHARAALYGFENFPAALRFDPLMAYPDGAPNPNPPLFDWTLAAVARLLVSDEAGFERVAAWFSPVIGVLAVLGVFAATRRLAGPWVALLAAGLQALWPLAVNYSRVGNPDHHGAVAGLEAVLLAASLALCNRTAGGASMAPAVAVGVAGRLALALVWSGSLLPLAVADASLLGVFLIWGRRRLAAAHALTAFATAIGLVPWVVTGPTPVAGAFSAAALSWLHVCAELFAAGVVGGLALLEGRRPAPSALWRTARAAGVASLGAGALLVLPAVRAGVGPALTFLTMADPVGRLVAEQRPLFSSAGLSAGELFGGFAYLVPVAPLLAWAWSRRSGPREASLCLAIWTAMLAPLALMQVRYGNDFAPAGCVAFGLGLEMLRRWLAARLPAPLVRARLAEIAVGAVVLALLWPALSVHARRWPQAAAYLRGELAPDRVLETPPGSLVRFAELVREATPEVAGFFDADAQPEYAILSAPALGHVLHYVARRATPANTFGLYLGAERVADVRAVLYATSEADALRVTDRLGVRYLVTNQRQVVDETRTLRDRLQREDGSARGAVPHLEHFRLVTEGPKGGLALAMNQTSSRGLSIPYKLFEIVPGAVLEIEASPGARVTADLTLRAASGRPFRFRAQGTADAAGRARLRVPYAAPAPGPSRAFAPYRVRAEGREGLASVTEDDIRSGRRLRVGLDAAAGSVTDPAPDAPRPR